MIILITLWLFNIAMENGPYFQRIYGDFPNSKMVIFQFATFHHQTENPSIIRSINMVTIH
jgi:hypothetical protein